jgi:hypothetical protein
MLAQVINVAQCYPPHPEDGEYLGCDFIEAPDESTSAAPSPSRASKKKKHLLMSSKIQKILMILTSLLAMTMTA